MTDMLLIAEGPEHDERLLADAARHAPSHVTVILDDYGEEDAARPASEATRADRLARLLAMLEDRTGAGVVGVLHGASRAAERPFDLVVRPGLPALA